MKCNSCPHECNIDRNIKLGKCRTSNKVKVAKYGLFTYEEPCISGNNGSGTIFFCNCNLSCVFCQNHEISFDGIGVEYSDIELGKIYLELQLKGAENINLVSPTIYIDNIVNSIKYAKKKGLEIPIVYNTNGYEKVESIKKLEGLVDIYLPDLKYMKDELGIKYSGVEKYPTIATNAILEMQRQVYKNSFNEKGMLQKGIIVRHLVLPNNIQNSKLVLSWIKENLNKDVIVSLMAQYFPSFRANEFESINRKLNKKEWDRIEKYFWELDFESGYIQELEKSEEKYVPDWSENE